ncbi:MAG: hypothetical protein ACOYJ8_00945 [Patescibacteria group bacterium]|jgi:hypothetical protein
MPRLKQKALFALLTLSLLALAGPSLALAQNKCGVNVGPNYGQVNQVKELTGQGGWIVALGTPGDCAGLESLFGKGLNVVIRAYNGGKAFDQNHALAWVATLGSLDSQGQKIYFMPWNEPNHNGECGGRPCSPSEISTYLQFLKNKLSEAGLLGNKVELLSPMIDKLHPRFEEFKGIYSLTNASSINEYDQFSSGPCSAGDPRQNNCQYDQIGIPAPYYAVEAGVTGTCSGYPCYKDNEIAQMLNTSWPKWQNDGNFKMLAVFSYDPHRPGNWDIFSSSQTKNFYQNNCFSGEVAGTSFNQNMFEDWLNRQNLVKCNNGCGWATSQEYCYSAGTMESWQKNTDPEIIIPKQGLLSTTFQIEYKDEEKESQETFAGFVTDPDEEKPLPKEEKNTDIDPKFAISGRLFLDEHHYPDFSTMEAIMSSALKKLLPEDLNNQLSIKTADNFSGQTKHYVYGLYREGEMIIEDPTPIKTPSQQTEAPSWWQKVIGKSKVLCGLFGSCQAPQSLSIEIAEPKNSSAPPRKTGNKGGEKTEKSKPANTEIENEEFSTYSIVQKIIKNASEYFKDLFETEDGSVLAWFLRTSQETSITGKDENQQLTLFNKTRGTVPGLETINEQAEFFNIFLPADIAKTDKDTVSASLAVKSQYEVSDNLFPGPGSEKINYHNLGATRKSYCLTLCAQYPANYPISQIDPLCPSCNPKDYQLTGYGDVILNKDLCQSENGACHYFQPFDGTNQGCRPGQDPICEGGRCNPYEIGLDGDYDACGGPPHGSCVDSSVCYVMTFAPNPDGGYGECQYANPNVCVRADRIQIGECAAVCNWACCEWQNQ